MLMKDLQNNLILKGYNFLFIEKTIQNYKKQNNISIKVLGYEDETTYSIFQNKLLKTY